MESSLHNNTLHINLNHLSRERNVNGKQQIEANLQQKCLNKFISLGAYIENQAKLQDFDQINITDIDVNEILNFIKQKKRVMLKASLIAHKPKY